MSHTNSTANYNLPQFVGSDKPAWLGDINPAMTAIDTAIKNVSDSASSADGKATTAQSDIATLGNTVTNLQSTVSTQGTQITTNTTEINSANTHIIGVENSLNALTAKFILNDITTSTVRPTGTTSNTLTLAQNSDGSIFKIYGTLQGTGISWPRVAIPGVPGQYGIATGLTLKTPPTEAFAIEGAILGIFQNVNNYSISDNIRPLAIYVGTDGKIYLWNWPNAGTSTTGSGVACRLWSPCCIYFNSNFGDVPTPDN